MFAIAPTLNSFSRIIGRRMADIAADATERWEICPSETTYVPPAAFLPSQIERIRGAEFGSIGDVVRDFRGDFEAVQAATLGFRLKDVDLVDGVLYGTHGVRHLRPRSKRRLAYRVPTERVSGAFYESWVGNRWFGNWLQDDCLTYRLAERCGVPATTTLRCTGHMAAYEQRLGIDPLRITRARFEELFVFFDAANNSSRRERALDLRARVIGNAHVERHPGVYLLRGKSGDRRLLSNEQEIAGRLARERGFRLLDPSTASLDELVRDCAGAAVVAGVEGGHLVHGLMLMPRDATLFVIQPPDRTVSVLKMTTDRQGQGYGFVVGEGNLEGFRADGDEVMRTLDLAETLSVQAAAQRHIA